VDRSSAEGFGALVEVPKGPRVVCRERVSTSAPGQGSRRGLDPSPENILLFEIKMEHFGAVFKLDLMKETRTQLQEEEAIASSCLILATPVGQRHKN